MQPMQVFDALNDGFANGVNAAARVFVRRASEAQLRQRYLQVLAERDHNAAIYREVAHKHNALVLENQRLRRRIQDLED
jgi:hypothetical protein